MIRKNAMNPFDAPTYPIWVFVDHTSGNRMPFRRPSFNPRKKSVMDHFGDSIDSMRYKVVWIVVKE
jgi:hypothetical protein